MSVEDLRISKLRNYLFKIIDDMLEKKDYQINADMLENKSEAFSLDRVPIQRVVEKWIIGLEIYRDVYSLRSRKAYSQDVVNNLKNIGFFEDFEKIINSNNAEGILPEIEGIESIECLNTGTLNNADTQTAVFDIQIQIQYKQTK